MRQCERQSVVFAYTIYWKRSAPLRAFSKQITGGITGWVSDIARVFFKKQDALGIKVGIYIEKINWHAY